ncbi:BCL2 modifying factor 2 [Paramormyrops kingsleyae]|uniref:Bcl2 modifying factor n=1 Tax=Paramormyrops kingsleyae TaxID=1676925 RepID=A0A3B3RH63_9TELE|nr:bcl-2-modifying factor [Paramormyrops kingsleyae]
MDDDDDDVFHTDPLTYQPPFRDIKCENRGTQTPGPALVQGLNMLPCGVGQEPRRLFYGSAGLRLHFPALSVPGGHPPQEERQPDDRPQPSAEVRIGQKLQMIGDQFHQDQLQLYHRNQRNQQPVWWRLVMALCGLLFERRQRAEQR